MLRRLRHGLGGGRARALLVAAAASAAVGLAVVAASHAATVAADLLKVRLGGDSAQARVVLDLDHAVVGKVVSDGSADGRIEVILQGVSTQGAQGAGSGLVKSWVAE